MERSGIWSRVITQRATRYSVAIFAVLAAVLARLALATHMRIQSPFLLLFVAVMIAASYGGLGPGILATVLATLASDYFFIGPPHKLGLISSQDRTQVAVFFIEGMVLSLLGAMLHRARRRAEIADASARQLEQKILEISEDERRRIGHDLHDGLGQHLTGIALLSKALRQRLVAMNLPESKQADQIAEFVNESIAWTRDLARGLSPVAIEADGLSPALEELATRASKLLGVECECRCAADPPVGAEAALHLYRIAQEAINNSVKHGRAKSVAIEVAARDSRVIMTIIDDGCGLSDKTRVRPGIGLQIMQYRATMIGATLSVARATSEGGTIVTCIVPATRAPLPASSDTLEQHDHHTAKTHVHQSESAPGR